VAAAVSEGVAAGLEVEMGAGVDATTVEVEKGVDETTVEVEKGVAAAAEAAAAAGASGPEGQAAPCSAQARATSSSAREISRPASPSREGSGALAGGKHSDAEGSLAAPEPARRL
jgi:hypothetical protein